jgi:DNA (cytosine-5)-methyltransferase 1
VFVVGYLGDWRRAAAVLFERESLSGNPAPSREEKQEAACWPAERAATLNASFGSKQGLEDQHALGGASWFVPAKDVAGPLTAGMHKGPRGTEGVESNHIVAYGFQSTANACEAAAAGINVSPTLKTDPMAVASALSVRRLTPTECERLQGFPDGFTQIPWRGKEPENCPDGPRYKALGNSFAVPCMRWIGERIQAVEAI